MIRPPQSPLRIGHQKTVFYGQGLDALDLTIWPEDTDGASGFACDARLHRADCITMLQSPEYTFQQAEIFRLGAVNGLEFLIDCNRLETRLSQKRCNFAGSRTV